MGDFNQSLDNSDKHGGRLVNLQQANQLRDVINGCQFIVSDYQELRYTWTNYRTGATNIRERIDRAWCNLQWHERFEDAVVKHLARAKSDHHPILLSIPRQQRERF